VIYVVPEILRRSVGEAQTDDLVLHHFQLQLAEDNLRFVWSSDTETPAEVKWQEQLLDQVRQRAEAEVCMLKLLLQNGRTTLASVKTTSNPASDAKSSASKSRPFSRGGMGLRGGVVVSMCLVQSIQTMAMARVYILRNGRYVKFTRRSTGSSTQFTDGLRRSNYPLSTQQRLTVLFSTTPDSCWRRKTSDGCLRLQKKSLHKSNFSIET
jgi:hypothetical protein